MLQGAGVASHLELINGGYGIKNPLLAPECNFKEEG